jgi:Tfp pilus assembly ATPase PilU
MVPAAEVMISNGRIVDRILDSTVTAENPRHHRTVPGVRHGTFDQALLELVRDGWVTVKDACHRHPPPVLGLLLQQTGLIGSDLVVP